MRGRTWTTSEIDYLQENYGNVSKEFISRKLDRSISAIENKVARLNLGRWYHNQEYMTINELATGLNVHQSTVKRWIDYHDLPFVSKRLNKTLFQMVRLDKFWEWAEKHRNMIEWDKVELLILGKEPDWLKKTRKAKFKSISKSTKRIPWTEKENSKLLWMLEQHKYTYPQISKELNRTHGAIKRRMQDLNIKLRPIYLDNHRPYTKEEIDTILELYKQGYDFKSIAVQLNRSEAGVRGKIEREGYTFRNKVLVERKEIEEVMT